MLALLRRRWPGCSTLSMERPAGARLELGYGRPIMVPRCTPGNSIAGLGGRGHRRGFSRALARRQPAGHVRLDRRPADHPGACWPRPHVFIPRPSRPPGSAPAPRPRRSPRADRHGDLGAGTAGACAGRSGRGSAGDWSAVYLQRRTWARRSAPPPWRWGAFLGSRMAAGRVAGDRLARAVRPWLRLVRASGPGWPGLGPGGRGLLVGTSTAAIAGFALLGLGLAGIFPADRHGRGRGLGPRGRRGRNIGPDSQRCRTTGPAQRAGSRIGANPLRRGAWRDALLVPAAPGPSWFRRCRRRE